MRKTRNKCRGTENLEIAIGRSKKMEKMVNKIWSRRRESDVKKRRSIREGSSTERWKTNCKLRANEKGIIPAKKPSQKGGLELEAGKCSVPCKCKM